MRSIKLALFLLTTVVLPSCSVSVPPPSVEIEVSSTTVMAGDLVTFEAMVSGIKAPYSYEWMSSSDHRSSISTYRETFVDPGTYSISLTVRYSYHSQRRSLSDRVTIIVKERDDDSDDDNGNDNDGGDNENDNDHGDNENDNQGQDNQNDNDSGDNENDNDAGNHNNNDDDGNENQNGNDNGNENGNDNESGDPPTVDLKVNGRDGWLTITDDEPVFVTLSWNTTGDSESCEAFGSWSGVKDDDDSEVVGPLGAGNFVFVLECRNDFGSDTDQVLVDVRIEEDEPGDLTVEIVSPADGSTHCCIGDPIGFRFEIDDHDGEFAGPFNYHFLFPDGEVIGTSDGISFTYSHTFPFEIQNGVVAVQVTDVPTGVVSNQDQIYLSVLP